MAYIGINRPKNQSRVARYDQVDMPCDTLSRQRQKIWEFSTYLHCSIVGTCLSTTELRKIIVKVKGRDLKGLSDLTILPAGRETLRSASLTSFIAALRQWLEQPAAGSDLPVTTSAQP